MIDTHIHLDMLTDDNALVNAHAAGVTDVIGIGVDPSVPSVPRVRVPAGLRIHHALGLHPQALVDEDQLTAGLALLNDRLAHEDVVAVGETGLDARKQMPNAALQQRAFTAQLQLARAHRLPIVLHGVRRDGAMLAALDDDIAAHGPLRAVWHGFSGSKDTLLHALARGVMISIGFIVLNPDARRVREAIAHLPLHRLLLETDAPPLEPERIVDVARAVAGLMNAPVDAVVAASTANARALFGLPATA